MVAGTVCAPGTHGFFWFPLIPLFFFGFWVLVLFVVRPWAWRRRGYGPGWSPAGSAEAVLAERYARGEVDESEYRARLEVLRAQR
ncbi:SHOCT domain-containing protein [Angustibacter luteus]|uniref:SHOCT domain-containing protein n=1 Tax=Angustibacter luteus TaxID=658456 RepID=A0ABW1JGR6_9ACTN